MGKLSLDALTYGRDAEGRKKLLQDLQADLKAAQNAFVGNELTNVIDTVNKYWLGSDANAFVKDLKEKANEVSKTCGKYSSFIETALTSDATNFEKMQSTNAGMFSGK